MPHSIDTTNAPAVAAYTERVFRSMYPGVKSAWLSKLFSDVDRLFCGGHPDYLPNDLSYHSLKHTLQATVCLVQLLAGRHKAKVEPRLHAHDFELAVAAVLLHDAGYLKTRSDREGTGAKYTFCHVLRSCSYAASYLPTLGATEADIEGVLGAITCTGPTKEISRLHFRQPIERIIGCSLATADFLSQIAASDYPDLLEPLFHEFEESDDYVHIPPSKRHFRSADELLERTPFFWSHYVMPKLEGDFQAVYRFLADPYPHGRNAYIEAIKRNIAKVSRRIAARRSKRPRALAGKTA